MTVVVTHQGDMLHFGEGNFATIILPARFLGEVTFFGDRQKLDQFLTSRGIVLERTWEVMEFKFELIPQKRNRVDEVAEYLWHHIHMGTERQCRRWAEAICAM